MSQNLSSYSAETFTLCNNCIELCTAYLGDDFHNEWPDWANTADELRIDSFVALEAPSGMLVLSAAQGQTRIKAKAAARCVSCDSPYTLELCLGLHDMRGVE